MCAKQWHQNLRLSNLGMGWKQNQHAENSDSRSGDRDRQQWRLSVTPNDQ